MMHGQTHIKLTAVTTVEKNTPQCYVLRRLPDLSGTDFRSLGRVNEFIQVTNNVFEATFILLDVIYLNC